MHAVRLPVLRSTLSLRHRGHLTAALGAAPAGFGAGQHVRIAACHLLALRRTALAGLGADAAGAGVQRRAAQHEVRAGLAGLGAIEQRGDVLDRGVLAAHAETVVHRRRADAVAAQARLNTALHLGVHPLGVVVHLWSSSSNL